MTLTSLATRRRLVKAAAILNDPDHPQHTLLADLVDTAIALDPDGDFAPWLEPGANDATPTELQCPDREAHHAYPSGIARTRRGGLIVRLQG